VTPAFGDARLAGVLAMLALISGSLHVRAEYRGPRALVYLFKPLTVACLLVLALAVEPVSVRYQAAVAVGLACSLAGDVFLMLPGDRFLPGVASFLLAHLAYLVAFTAGVPLGAGLLPLVPYALLGGSMLAVLWRGLGTLRIPVAVYVVVIVAMAWRAAGRAETLATAGARLAAVGAALFVLSDALLALNRFRRPFRSAQAVIHATYYAAQLAIAWSVGVA
jgi:uncharacterized membrane protein YhhN